MTRTPFLIKALGFFSICFCSLESTPLLSAQPQSDGPAFSRERGFYDRPFELSLTSPNSTIYFTTDGSVPTPGNGTLYQSRIPIETTSVIRAVAYDAGGVAGRVETHTFIFLEDVIRQPASPRGWPNYPYNLGFMDPPNGGPRQHFSKVFDYEMDPDIVDDPAYREQIIPSLLSVPTIAVTMDQSEFWESYNAEAESKIENPASIEVIYPEEPEDNEQIDAGLLGHSQRYLKRSLRLAFRSEYGAANWDTPLLKKAPLNGSSAVDEFDRLVLRAGKDRSWSLVNSRGNSAFTRDQWLRDSQIAMSGIGSHGSFVHVYINGMYWGLYNVAERPDDHFCSAYMGGENEDWFAMSSGGSIDGDTGRFDRLNSQLVWSDPKADGFYDEFQNLLDIEHFADYLIVSWMSGVADWPQNNFWACMRTVPEQPMMYFGWDAEWSWTEILGANAGAWVPPMFVNDWGESWPLIPVLWRIGRVNSDFMTLFADRVYKHTHNNGVLSDANSQARWMALNEHVRDAIVAESARWGDTLNEAGFETRTRDIHWQGEVDRVNGMMEGNAAQFIAALREEGYYPSIDPPTFGMQGGQVEAGYRLRISDATQSNHTIYYTTDGSDPRLPGGVVSAQARTATGSVELPVTASIQLKARIKVGNEWSALNEALFTTTQDFDELVINEIMYHPAVPEGEDDDTYDFLELHNAGSTDLDLAGASFTDGIDFTFPAGSILGAGGFLVLAADADVYQTQYGSAPFGVYTGRLSNSGESLVLSDMGGAVIDSVEYSDQEPWPTAADGDGLSLELVDPTLDNALASSWLGSQPGGSPNAANNPNAPPLADLTSPTDNARFDPGTVVTLEADASDTDGTVDRVIFYADNTRLGTADTAPYSYTWESAPVGTYDVQAVAVDDVGNRGRSDLIQITIATENACEQPPPALLINEINYNSSIDFDPGDWVEIYNPESEALNVEGWVLKDENDLPGFIFPAGAVIPAQGFLVVIEDSTLFEAVFQGSDINYVGAFGSGDGFGLGNGGDEVRLYSPQGCMVNAVEYDDEEPWPLEPDGQGYTLSLDRTFNDNTVPAPWAASKEIGGTPGLGNFDLTTDIETDDALTGLPERFELEINYPNPFNQVTTIRFSIPETAPVRISVFSLLGEQMEILLDRTVNRGRHEVQFDGSPYAPGVYYYVIESGSFREARRMTLIR